MNAVTPSSPRSLSLRAGDVTTLAHHPHALWQLRQGMLLSLTAGATGHAGWRLLMPGDWVNLESLGGPYATEEWVALAPSTLDALASPALAETNGWLRQVMQQLHSGTAALLALRSGPVERRIQRLLTLLRDSGSRPSPDPGEACDVRSAPLPPLRWVALLLDTAPETACRALAKRRERTPQALATRHVRTGRRLGADLPPTAWTQTV